MAVGNTFGATALSSYGGFWIAYGSLFHPDWNIFASHQVGGDGEYAVIYSTEDRFSGVGFFLTGWFIFTTLLLVCTLKSTVMFFLLFFTLDLAFLFLACENYAGSMGNETAQVALQKAGGVFGMFAAFLAWYNALAGIQDNRYVSDDVVIVGVLIFLIRRLTGVAATRSSRCPSSPCPGPTRPRPTAPPSSSTPPKENTPAGAARMGLEETAATTVSASARHAGLDERSQKRHISSCHETILRPRRVRRRDRGTAGLGRLGTVFEQIAL